MKNWIIRLSALFGVLLVVALIVIFNAGFQRKVLLDALRSHVDAAEVKRFKVNLRGIKMEELRVLHEGTEVKLESLFVRWSLKRSLLKRALMVDTLLVDNLQVYLPGTHAVTAIDTDPSSDTFLSSTPEEPHAPVKAQTVAKAASKRPVQKDKAKKAEAFKGFLPKQSFTKWINIEELQVFGSAHLSALQKATLKITGEKIYPNQTSQCRVQVNFTDEAPNAQVDTIKCNGKIYLNNKDYEHHSIKGDFNLLASGKVLETPHHAKLDFNIAKAPEHEQYSFHIWDNNSEARAVNVVSLESTYNAKKNALTGLIRLKADKRQLLPFALGITLPEFESSAKGDYTFSFVDKKGGLELAGDLKVQDISSLNPALKALDNMSLSLVSAVEFEPKRISIQKVDTSIKDKSANAVLDLALLRPFEIVDNKLNFQGDLIKCSINRFPLLQLVSAFSGLQVEGNDLSADYTLKAISPTELVIVNDKPPALENVNISTDDGQKIAQALNCSFTSKAQLKIQDRAQLEGISITITSNGQSLLEGGLGLTITLKKPSLLTLAKHFTLYIDEIAKQPIIQALGGQPSALPLTLNCKLIADCSQEKNSLDIHTLRIEGCHDKCTTAPLSSALMFNLLQPLSISLSDKTITPPTLKGPLGELRFSGFQTSSLTPFLPGLGLKDEGLEGLMSLTYSLNDLYEHTVKQLGIKATAAERLKLKYLSLSHQGVALLDRVSLSCLPAAFYSPSAMQLKVADWLVQDQANAQIAKGGLELALDPSGKEALPQFKISAGVDLEQVTKQPCVQTLVNLGGGSLSFEANSNALGTPERTLHLDVVGKSIRNKASNTTIEALRLLTDVSWIKAKKFSLKCPLEVDGAQGKTKASLEGLVKFKPTATRFDFQLKGDRVSLTDLLALADTFKVEASTKGSDKSTTRSQKSTTNQESAAKSSGSIAGKPPAKASSEPPWATLDGTAEVDLKHILYSAYAITDLKANLDVKPEFIKLEPCTACFSGAPFRLNFLLNYLKAKKVYDLTGAVSLKALDAGKLLSEMSPSKHRPITGVFNLQGNIKGEAKELNRLADTVQGQFSLQGGPGRIYVIQTPADAPAKADIRKNVLGMAGDLLKSSVKELTIIDDLKEYFKEIPYDSIIAKVERGQDLNIQLTEVLIQGPELYISGRGAILHQAGVPVPGQALSLPVQLNAKGKAATLLSKLGLLSNQKNPQGYMVGPTFMIKGTVAKPNWDNFWEVILQAVSTKAGNIVNPLNLFGPSEEAPAGEAESSQEPLPAPLKAVEGFFKSLKK